MYGQASDIVLEVESTMKENIRFLKELSDITGRSEEQIKQDFMCVGLCARRVSMPARLAIWESHTGRPSVVCPPLNAGATSTCRRRRALNSAWWTRSLSRGTRTPSRCVPWPPCYVSLPADYLTSLAVFQQT